MEDIRTNGRVLSFLIQNVSESAIKSSGLFPKNSIIISTTATIGEHALITVDFIANQQLTCLYRKNDFINKINMKYIYHYFFIIDELCKKMVHKSGGMPIVDMEKFKKISIPVPPLHVQEEIVRILDTFSELTAELTAELTKRKQQYQYYRDNLLFNVSRFNNIKFEKLKNICSISIGEFVHKSKQKENGKYPVFNGGISYTGFYDEYNNSGNKIIISARGANAGYVNKISGKFWAGNSCYSIETSTNNIHWIFLYYFLKNIQTKLIGEQQKGSIPAISKKQMEELIIPVPPLEEQKRIVSILDRFDALCNDLTSGLPAEIEARKKQYEYYRDKLLTFKEAV